MAVYIIRQVTISRNDPNWPRRDRGHTLTTLSCGHVVYNSPTSCFICHEPIETECFYCGEDALRDYPGRVGEVECVACGATYEPGE